MFQINTNYQKLPGSYLFSTIAKKVNAFSDANPDKKIIRLGIGDVTQPIAPAIVAAMHKAVDEMGNADTFHGYAPDLGYDFLRKAIAKNDYHDRGCDISEDEIFVSDGAKSDSANIQELFSADSKIAVCDPVYPVYVDSNVMAGRTGTYNPDTERWSNVIYMPCTAENHFVPEFPEETPDLIYLCLPNNPTGTTLTKAQLKEWVDYANRVGAVIIYDGAYEAYISQEDVAHSIYECDGAKTCAIEAALFFQKRRVYRSAPGLCGCAEGIKMRRRIPARYVGEAARDQIQRRAVYRTARRRSRIFPGRKSPVKRTGRLLYEKRDGNQTGADRFRLYGFWRRQRAVYLVKNAQRHDVLGFL